MPNTFTVMDVVNRDGQKFLVAKVSDGTNSITKEFLITPELTRVQIKAILATELTDMINKNSQESSFRAIIGQTF